MNELEYAQSSVSGETKMTTEDNEEAKYIKLIINKQVT